MTNQVIEGVQKRILHHKAKAEDYEIVAKEYNDYGHYEYAAPYSEAAKHHRVEMIELQKILDGTSSTP